MTIKIIPNEKGNPPGNLTDVELPFKNGIFEGLKLIGFSVWERRGGGRNVTFPARQYSINGERRSFALLRPLTDTAAQDRIRDVILEAYAEHELKPPRPFADACRHLRPRFDEGRSNLREPAAGASPLRGSLGAGRRRNTWTRV